jgi:hypothetical protein
MEEHPPVCHGHLYPIVLYNSPFPELRNRDQGRSGTKILDYPLSAGERLWAGDGVSSYRFQNESIVRGARRMNEHECNELMSASACAIAVRQWGHYKDI